MFNEVIEEPASETSSTSTDGSESNNSGLEETTKQSTKEGKPTTDKRRLKMKKAMGGHHTDPMP
ncbi:uncharacterized protein LOC143244029 isoform X2 [Tachypleus tridentatus]|uniref:uncharacterized protein LOC143244029 isoform X2 n=1 Tax=Tachypleus tridentatus TaxID=6853 RepID=UPI003FD0A47A